MAITKLMHMKESPGTPHTHLKNAIDYILDVAHGGEKTDFGQYVGGNSGTDADEILENFLDTKRFFGKPDGRQGYHFVVSFPPGTTDKETAYAVIQQWCEEYLGADYDYVFALHTDTDHLHGHIVFNSVRRTDGYKYHYQKGDWEKYIQPITDRICEAHGLEPLTFDEEERVGVSYASWAEKKKEKINWSNIIRADIDHAISHAESFEDFTVRMEQMNYTIRLGRSKEFGNYFTYSFHDEEGKVHSRRSYKLPPGYKPEEVANRIRAGDTIRYNEELLGRFELKAKVYLMLPVVYRNTRTFQRLYQAVNYYRLPNPYAVPAYRVRKDMLRIDQLIDECRYIKEHELTSPVELTAQKSRIEKQLYEKRAQRKVYLTIQEHASLEELQTAQEVRMLTDRIEQSQKEGGDAWEVLEDERNRLIETLPAGLSDAKERIDTLTAKIKELEKENRMLTRILATEQPVSMKQKQKQKEQKERNQIRNGGIANGSNRIEL